MKANLKTLFFIVTIEYSVILTSCKKYPEGPSLSLRTKSARLSNSWKIQSYKFNNIDSTTFVKSYLLNNYLLTINKQGSYSMQYNVVLGFLSIPFNEAGKWAFSNNKKNVIFTKESGNTPASVGSNSNWEILRLKESELWAKYTLNNDVTEVHLN
jgi:hypothetical protein